MDVLTNLRMLGTGEERHVSEYMATAHGFMTLIADDGRLDGMHVAPPRAAVGWVVTLRAFPCDVSLHLDRKDLESLADRISQALQDHDSLTAGPHDPHKRSPGADDEGVDLDDPAFLGRPEQE